MSRRNFVAPFLVAAIAGALALTTAAKNPDALRAETTRIERPTAATPTPAPLPFAPAEELIYQAEFSKLLLRGINIAEFKFTAGRAASHALAAPASTGGSTASGDAAPSNVAAPLAFTGDIVSRGLFRKLFGINFHYRVESLVERDGFKILRTTKLDEQGKRVRTSEAIFDRTRNQISWTERDPNDATRPPRIVNAPLEGATHDIITAIYFLRTQTLTPGQTLELVISDSGQVYRIPARVLAEKKKMKSVVGKVAVVRVDVEMFGEGRLVKDNGRMSIWFTDDARRLPVRARISSDPGTLDITLKSVKKQ